MIDFSSVYKNGLVVRCRTEEESDAFWKEAGDAFPNAHVYSSLFRSSHQIRHNHYGDRVAYYLYAGDGDYVNTEWCYEGYYRDHHPYCYSEFVEYRIGNCSQSDLGDLEVDGAANISLLFLGEVLT